MIERNGIVEFEVNGISLRRVPSPFESGFYWDFKVRLANKDHWTMFGLWFSRIKGWKDGHPAVPSGKMEQVRKFIETYERLQ